MLKYVFRIDAYAHLKKRCESRMPLEKIILDENEMPKQWYNILPDLPRPLPPIIDPATRRQAQGSSPRSFPKRF